MRGKYRGLLATAVIAACAAGAWAQAKKSGEEVEGQVKQAALFYLLGVSLGDADLYFKAARMPLQEVRDGVGKPRDEKAARALLAAVAARLKTDRLSDEDRKRVATNMLGLMDQTSVQFIGANTATLPFPIRPAAKPGDPESLLELILHRKDGRWQVIAEVSDSAPVPPEYLK